MRNICTLRVLFVFLCVWHSLAAFADSAQVNKLSPKDIRQAASTAQWKKILFYVPSWSRGEMSIVDDSEFFLHAKGKTNPEFELEETVKAFSEGTLAERQEALCKYPARRKFLEETFRFNFADTDPQNESTICKRFKVFSNKVRSESVSLIFSSYFPGNPGSLFGHTLLKFKKKTTDDTNGNSLLDYGLNHAAYPSTSNPVLYPIMGLGGMFPGMVSMMPYYVKVQEYNNAESRDLWEYELNLNREEVSLMLASVFELSTHRIDYYYFDDNCSYLMLALIDVGRPSLDLISKFNAWVIPGDTVRVVANVPSLVEKVHFRPSNVRKYLFLERSLSDKERNAFNALMFNKDDPTNTSQKTNTSKINLKSIDALDSKELTHVLDTALEFIDATEQLSAGNKPTTWKNERELLLKMRAELGTVSVPVDVPVPESEAPHIAYPPTRLSLGVVNASRTGALLAPALLLGWRPALHTLDNPVAGMGADLGVGFFNLEFLARGRNISLREFTALSIEAIPLAKPHMKSVSWALNLGHRQRCFQGCRQTYINGEFGYAFPTESQDGRYALRAGARLGDDEFGMLFIEPAIIGIANVPMKLTSRWVSRVSLSRLISLREPPRWLIDGSTTYVYRPATPWELQAGAELHNKELQFMARTLYYF